MTAQTPVAEFPGFATVRTRIDGLLDDFLTHKTHTAGAQKMPGEVPRTLHDFLFGGGKRLRPLLCVAGWHAAGGHGNPAPALQVAASLEMFHAFALIHDDIMDNSATRRGRPTVHRQLAARHRGGRSTAAADHLGAGAAILIGDLALAWSDELLHTAGLSSRQFTRVLPLVDTMRTEVMYGQYLDLAAAGTLTDDVELALTIVRYKTAKYTVERPLHIGAALAGTTSAVQAALTAYAIPLGEAFQLRDDLLGVFGKPGRTGKPCLDDLRDGKATVLTALTLKHASRAQAGQLRLSLGCPTLTEDQAEVARRIITATGAPDRVEEMITKRYERALAALETAPFGQVATATLHSLAESAVRRHA
ncbi:polyprenyl synthetase family protein [Streptomyces sp. NPDC020379]|uniref:polyprenyl synthetase family protein n=1 Tax=Streptomyces sp. NPDC020379 TaxID=3365071 RepID=UPI00379B27ED